MLVLVVLYLALVFVIPLVLGGAIGWRRLPIGCRCPRCGDETSALQSTPIRLVSKLVPRFVLQRRWCMTCAWTGIARQPRARLPRRRPRPLRPVTPAVPLMRTMSIRAVAVDGRPYRVLLQCWQQTGTYFGRLVFIGPAGQMWTGAVEPVRGSSPTEVLQLATAVPAPLLAARLRRLATR